MNYIWRTTSWKGCMALSIGILLMLIVMNFYGLYTDRFYFFKVDNYIFPLLTIVHFSFLQAIQMRISSKYVGDLHLRNLEYAMYAILLVYIFKVLDTSYILLSYSDYEARVIPENFMPYGTAILTLQICLVGLTFLSFGFRRNLIGRYNFDHVNDKLDSW